MNLEHNSDYRRAQEKLAWERSCREYMQAVASAITGAKCPMMPSAVDFDICVKQLQEAISELFYDETSEAKRIMQEMEREDYSAMQRELRTA